MILPIICGVMFGSPETTPGGRALKFSASVRMDIRRFEWIKDGTEAIGSRVRVKIVKSKVAPPFRQAEFDLMFGEGISKEGCVLDMAVCCGICNRSGSWYTYKEDKLGQGREAAKDTLKTNVKLFNEIEAKVRKKYGIANIENINTETKKTSDTLDVKNSKNAK